MKLTMIALLAAVSLCPPLTQDPVVTQAADVKWGDHPAVKGAFLAVQSGDPAKGAELGAGGFIQVPGQSPHWAFAKEEFIITVSFNGAVDFRLCGEQK